MVKANTPAMTPMAIAKAKRRMRVLKERDLARQEKLRRSWMSGLKRWARCILDLCDFPQVAILTSSYRLVASQFDTDGDGAFQRDELRQLLISSPTIRSPTRRR